MQQEANKRLLKWSQKRLLPFCSGPANNADWASSYVVVVLVSLGTQKSWIGKQVGSSYLPMTILIEMFIIHPSWYYVVKRPSF